MNKLVCLLVLAAAAAGPVFGLPSPDGFFTDATGRFGDLRPEVTELCRGLEEKTGCEFAILIVPDMGGLTVEDYGEQVFRAWGVGKKGTANGLLFVVALKERAARLEVGYGLESVLPDSLAARLLVDYAVPSFRENDWRGGIRRLVPAVAEHLAARYAMDDAASPLPVTRPERAGSFFTSTAFLLLLLALGAVFVFNLVLAGTRRFLRKTFLAVEIALAGAAAAAVIVFFAPGSTHGLYLGLSGLAGVVVFAVQYSMSARHTCPKCRKYMEIRSMVIDPPTYTSTGRRRISYSCPACSYTHARVEVIPVRTRSSGGGFRSGGGSSGGGGFSFGGGSSGGGGASVHF